MGKLFLFLLSVVYGMITAFRNWLYDYRFLKSTDFEIPVISVGNITVGGTGKTPHIEYLVRLLEPQYRVAVLSRGYKRLTKGFRMVGTTSSVEESGDEPLQVKRNFPGITVAVCEDRVAGVRELLQQKTPPDVVLLDDAFQHRKITPGISIVLMDYNKPLKEDHLLPYGRLRENQVQLRRANIIIITKCPKEIKPITRRIMAKDVSLFPYQELYFTTMTYGSIYPVYPGPVVQQDLFSNTGERGILVVAGIASPDSMIQHVKKQYKEVELAIFPDHHHYSPGDILSIIRKFELLGSTDKIILTTQKDVAKLISHENISDNIKRAIYCLPMQVRFLEQEGKTFDKKIKEYVGDNKSNREIHFRKNSNKR